MFRILICFVSIYFLMEGEGGSLSRRDYESGPIAFSTDVDSLIGALGNPNAVEQSVDFCGKGPRMRGDQVIEGDTTYCDSVTICRYDSLTICAGPQRQIEYYSFTTTKLKTFRGVRVGDSREKVKRLYGTPTWMDSAYVFDEPLQGEDDAIQYVGFEDNYGIVFFFTNGIVRRIFIGRGSAC